MIAPFVYRLRGAGDGEPSREVEALCWDLGLMTLTWPAGYRLQHRETLYTGDWETLDVTSPYDATLTAGQGYFRVVP